MFLAAALVVALLGSCQEDLGLDGLTYSCETDSDCLHGLLCGAQGLCVDPGLSTGLGDTLTEIVYVDFMGGTDDGAQDLGAEIFDPCPAARLCEELDAVECQEGGADYQICESAPQCGLGLWSEPVDGCWIGGVCLAPHTPNPAMPCLACQPTLTTQAYTALAAGMACEDGDPCTVGTTCTDLSTCLGGDPVLCDDGLPCTVDTCEPEAGGCVYSAMTDDRSCDDLNPCTLADACLAGDCVSELALDCDDQNPCTLDSCDPGLEAGCVATFKEDGFSCGAYPHGEALCEVGGCKGSCDPGWADCDGAWLTGCETHTDGSLDHCGTCDYACSVGEVCAAGECAGGCGDALSFCPSIATCADTDSDPLHCGDCDAPCPAGQTSTLPACAQGVCGFEACPEGQWNANGELGDGCEYKCELAGPELCNEADDDCDDQVDEDFDTTSDPEHCGACGQPCQAPQVATAICAGGACSVAGCEEGFYDMDGLWESGCEIACTPSGDELCNGQDDDCDGAIDEAHQCPSEDPSGVGICDGGVCAEVACESGTWNLDEEPMTGCEYECTQTALPGADTCGWGDQDCDGEVDEDGSQGDGSPCPPPATAVISMSGTEYNNAGATCALRGGGSVFCWGNGWTGQLGYGLQLYNAATPERVLVSLNPPVALSGIVQMDGGYYGSCALDGEGQSHCWGWSENLGGGGAQSFVYLATLNILDPDGQASLEGLAEVAQGRTGGCAVMEDTTARCWGFNVVGEIGNGSVGGGPFTAQVVLGPDGATPLSGVTKLAAGTGHASQEHRCALRSDESLWCWGNQYEGQLGDGKSGVGNDYETLPTQVLGPYGGTLEGVTDVDGGYHFTCAVAADPTGAGLQRAFCWGTGSIGQLGQGVASSQNTPVAVTVDPIGTPLGPVLSLSTGYSHACAVTQDHQVVCWGDGRVGALGDADAGIRPWAEPVEGLQDVVGVLAGYGYSCAWTAQGDASCWGRNVDGHLGLGTYAKQTNFPQAVEGLGSIVDVQVGTSAVCARSGDGTTRCWGRNSDAQLGLTMRTARPVPAEPVADPAGSQVFLSHLALGDKHACGLDLAGTPLCWGYNAYGQLGNGLTSTGGSEAGAANTLAQGAGELSEVQAFAVGGHHSCAIDDGGDLWCWGTGSVGTVGDGLATQKNPLPTRVVDQESQSLGEATALSAGPNHACAIRGESAEVWCWGKNAKGEVGDGSLEVALSARPVLRSAEPTDTLSGMADLSLGEEFSCAMGQGGLEIWCWGSDSDGQLGNGDASTADSPYATQVSMPVGVIAAHLRLGFEHACLLTTEGKVLCWGQGEDGQQGYGSTGDRSVPGGVPALAAMTIVDLDAGGYTTCAVDDEGGTWCWGSNLNGQLGDGKAWVLSPTPVIGLDQGCAQGQWDINGDASDGCEYTCEPVGLETCDGLDEDCDGLTDEGFDLQTDPLHCGACGAACGQSAGATNVSVWSCEEAACAVETCAEGFWDQDGDVGNGCEYACTPSGVEPLDQGEVCNGIDDDCDFQVDEGSGAHLCGGEGMLTDSSQVGACVEGACQTVACPEGSWNLDLTGTCEYACDWSSESDGCGGGDEDCDGEQDEDGQDCPPGAVTIVEVACGDDLTCARRQDSTLWCWGANEPCSSADSPGGSLGSFTGAESPSAVQVPLPAALGAESSVLDLAGGGGYSCAVVTASASATSGGIWCWGAPQYNAQQLGATLPGEDACAGLPVQVNHWESGGAPLEGFTRVSVGHESACGLHEDGTLWCWGGGNFYGDKFDCWMGDGVCSSKKAPFQVLSAEGGPPFDQVVDLSAGSHVICGARQDGSAWCWGLNDQGNLGNGAESPGEAFPTQVVDSQGAPLGGVVEVQAGGSKGLTGHVCARTGGGDIWCWGENDQGQLATGGTEEQDHAVKATGAFGASLGVMAHMAVGTHHTCAASGAGAVWCWGDNRRGQAGDDHEPYVYSAQEVAVIDGLAGLSAGAAHSCAWTLDGQVHCWGDNTAGKLGLGFAAGPVLSPAPVLGLSGATEVAVGKGNEARHACASSPEGIFCWGANYAIDFWTAAGGELGTGTMLTQPRVIHPVVDSAGGAISGQGLSMGTYSSSAIVGGQSWRWGFSTGNMSSGAYMSAVAGSGGGPFAQAAHFAAEGAAPDVNNIYAGDEGALIEDAIDQVMGNAHVCFLREADEYVWCNGNNKFGRLANGLSGAFFPTRVLTDLDLETPLVGATALFAGPSQTCALVGPQAELWCWGLNSSGGLGNGESGTNVVTASETAQVARFEDQTPFSGAGKVAMSESNTCALDPAGLTLWCWGWDSYGSLGNGPDTASSPWVTEVEADLPPLIDVAVGFHHVCVLAQAGQVYCWGRNHMGQLGDGTQTNRPSPWLSGVSDATQIAAGGHTTCALHLDGHVSCWGDGASGQTGDDSFVRFEPTGPVLGLQVACAPGTWDTDGDLSDGCELTCEPTGPESCDGQDEDCDGQVDEGLPGCESP